jgi:hypothetical protein
MGTQRVIRTIPVYEGTTPEESWALIVRMDGEPINLPVIGWANVENISNSNGETATVVLDLEQPEDWCQ